MDPRNHRAETFEERLIFWAILGTWGFWITGTISLVAPALGWYLGARSLWVVAGLDERRPTGPPDVPFSVMLWLIGMGAMAIILVIGHIDYELGAAKTMFSLNGWARTWALLGLFIFAGSVLPLRLPNLMRAVNILALMTLILLPIFYIAVSVGAPYKLYVSPFVILGGLKDSYDVAIVQPEDAGSTDIRLCFYAPWAPAASLAACMSLVFAFYERSWGWRTLGIVSAVAVCLTTHSRQSYVAMPMVLAVAMLGPSLLKPRTLTILAALTIAGMLVADTLAALIDDVINRFSSARITSSRVRATLQAVAIHRWQAEAWWFGHGVVERGSQATANVTIGSHHTWNSLLFVKGMAGFLALLIPMAWTTVELGLKAQSDPAARVGFCLMLVIVLFSFGETIDLLAYLIWPAFLAIGMGLRRRLFNPFRSRLGFAVA